MDARVTKAEFPLPFPVNAAPPHVVEAEIHRLAAMRARDVARAARARQRLAQAVDGLRAIPAALRAYLRRRRARLELESLTDRQLADIGLTRGDIGRILVPGALPRPTPAPVATRPAVFGGRARAA